MKLVPILLGGVALVAVAYAGYAFVSTPPKMTAAPGGPNAPAGPGTAPPTAPSRAGATATAPVIVAVARKATVPVTLATIGNAQAFSSVAIKSQVDGQIFEVHFREGQLVKKGDLLFSLDARPFEAALRQAEANLAKDKALLEKAKADLVRYAALVEKDYTSRSNYDLAKATAASLDATIKGDETVIDMAKLRLEYTRIAAPIDGRVGSILINAGNLVKANDTVSLVVINQIKPIYIQFTVPESTLAEIKRRMAASKIAIKAAIPDDRRPPAIGVLSFVNNAVDVGTGTIQLKATYDNEDDRFTPGQYVNVTVELTVIPDAIVIPSAAVQAGQSGSFVFVVKADDTVELRNVKVGVTADRDVVIEQGVQIGERVVVDGQLRLRPGSKVTIRQPGAPATPGRTTGPNQPPG